jgi:hypothetical protein
MNSRLVNSIVGNLRSSGARIPADALLKLTAPCLGCGHAGEKPWSS